VDTSADAFRRASDLAWDCPEPATVRAIWLIARMLTVLADEAGCPAGEVAADELGYWLSFSHRAWELLGLPDDRHSRPDWERERAVLAQVARVVAHAWLVQVGRLRLGDHVIITPESLTCPAAPQRGVVTGAEFHNPDWHASLPPGRLGQDPWRVFIRLGDPRAGVAGMAAEDPWGVLLDEACHPGERERAAAIRAYTAARDLSHARTLIRMQGPAVTRAYLQRRAQFYPDEVAAIFRDAAAAAELDPGVIARIARRLP
jgi:hypothetical protein